MLVVVTTHPIQYQVPLWQAIAAEGSVPFQVWYCCNHAVTATHDREFGRSFSWNLGKGTLEGYDHRFLEINEGWNLHPSKLYGLRLTRSLEDDFRRVGAKVLWIQGWQKWAYWQAAKQARQVGIPVWLRGESNDLAPVTASRAWVKRRWLSLLFRNVSQYLTIGTANRRFYLGQGIPPSQLHAAPYAVDNERFASEALRLRSERRSLRRVWGIPDDAFCVLFCGKFIPKKRPMDLVAAAALVAGRASSPPLHLLFVGSGELGPELRAATTVVMDVEKGVGVASSTRPAGNSGPTASFAGFLNQHEISRAYVAADALVLPSDHGETWGLVVNEAMASGLPCAVSSACGCGEDLVEPVDPRLRFPLGDVGALADAIDLLRTRPGDFSQAIAAAISRHRYQHTLDTIKSLYHRLPSLS